MADENDNASGTISYSIKELLDGIKSSIDKVYGKLDTKADRSEVIDLAQRVNNESKRVDALETTRRVEQTNTANNREWTRWVVPSLIALAMLGVTLLQTFKGGR